MANLSKFQRMQRFFPNFYALGQNQVLTGFMGAVCEADENIVVQIEETKNQLFVNFADGKYLDLLGSSYGVYRPSVVSVNDDVYRQLIPKAAFCPKTIRPLIYDIFDIFWGKTASRPNITSTLAEPYNFGTVPMYLTLIANNQEEKTIKFVDADFEFNNAATAEEICTKINYIYSNYITAQVYTDELTDNNYIQIYTNTPGEVGSIQITGGTANAQLAFETTKIQTVDVCIYELYPKHIILKVPATIPLLSNNVVSHYFHATQDIVDGRPNVDTANPWWPGHFFFQGPASTDSYTPTGTRCLTTTTISAGNIYTSTLVNDCSNFPDEEGRLIVGFGSDTAEEFKYYGRMSNNTIALDPSYTFEKTWPIGTYINLMIPKDDPANDGSDFAIYMIDTEVGRALALYLIDLIKAAGIIVQFDITDTAYLYQDYFWSPTGPAIGTGEKWFAPPAMDDSQQSDMVTGVIPAGPVWGLTDAGKIWFNTTYKQLMMWDGTVPVIVG